MRLVAVAFFGTWAGATLLLAQLRWFSRRSLADRLAPYIAGHEPRARHGFVSGQPVREVLAPMSRSIGDGLARALGASEDVGTRLDRIHSSTSASEFRLDQLGWSVVGMAAGALMSLALGPPTPVVVLLLAGLPVLAFLIVEQRLATASAAWQRRVFLELPVVAEQLAMLVGAGYSVSAALTRLSARGHGSVARDLARVSSRIRHGAGEVRALREWSLVAGVPAVERLVALLALNREAADLGRLLSDEARAMRRDVHRELIETMERRGQQVWIPVTVATLLPGALFLAVPFIEALNLFAGS